jgi:iron complex transport system substrate-binding protein
MRWIAGGLAASLIALGGASAANPASRVFSLDQCADQYVIAMAPRNSIVGVSPRVTAADSYLKAQAAGLPKRRATAEAVLAAQPDIVVRFWGGDARLDQTLTRRRLRVVRIDEAEDFNGVRANIRKVAAALGQALRGEALIARMDAQLSRGVGAWRGQPALYLTPGGFTAGRGTLIAAMLRGAGLNDVAPPGYGPVPLEQLVMHPPRRFVLGFFEGDTSAAWGPGRQGVLRRLAATRIADSLPGSILGCPAWFAGDAVQSLAAQAGR